MAIVATEKKQHRLGGLKRQRQQAATKEAPDVGSEGREREDACLGLFAEAFADDLDLLRKDEHFGGSARDVAAMADMMRCLAGGLDETEQQLLLENARR